MNTPAAPPDFTSASSTVPATHGRGGSTLRIGNAVTRGPGISFFIDGQPVQAFEGESVAAALYASGRRTLRNSPRAELPRGVFCMMGSCQECLVWAGAKKLPSCQLRVTAGLVVETLSFREQQHG